MGKVYECCSMSRVCCFILGKYHSWLLAFQGVLEMKENDFIIAPKVGWRDLLDSGMKLQNSLNLADIKRTSLKTEWWEDLTSLKIWWSDVGCLKREGSWETLSGLLEETEEGISDSSSITPVFQGRKIWKNILIFVWGIWKKAITLSCIDL